MALVRRPGWGFCCIFSEHRNHGAGNIAWRNLVDFLTIIVKSSQAKPSQAKPLTHLCALKFCDVGRKFCCLPASASSDANNERKGVT